MVASLSAPSLFLIAKDLSKMEVWATVNEVDVGKIKVDPENQDVKFTVDAFPGRVYHGKVVPQGKLPFRLNATMNQNVVTYTVVVSVDNKRTGTAPALHDGQPDVHRGGQERRPAGAQRRPALAAGHASRSRRMSRDAYYQLKGKKRSPTDPEAQDHGFVWVKGDDGYVRYIEVQTGLSDSVNTEVLGVIGGGELPEHTQVIVGEGAAGERAATEPIPFVATPFKKKE